MTTTSYHHHSPPGPPSRAPGCSPMSVSGLEWLGPLTFTRRYASRRVDHDLGGRWGPRREQRLTHRHELGAGTGMLYVYDPTWGEYAVLAEAVSLDAVRRATTRAATMDPRLPVTVVADLALAYQLGHTPPAAPADPGARVQL